MPCSAISYWDAIAEEYQTALRISVEDFHYAPLLYGDRKLRLLPSPLTGLHCLELGCGGAQNSVFLARQGTRCSAVDGSPQQLQHAAKLARQGGVKIDLIEANLEEPLPLTGTFDLVHSAYALPFLSNQKSLLYQAAEIIRPGGHLIFSTAHPLANTEWFDIEDLPSAVMLPDYFHPPVDQRELRSGGQVTVTPLPITEICETLAESGMQISRLIEPQPAPVETMTDAECREFVPYDGECWRHQVNDMRKIPKFLIIKAVKP